jgi:putative CocE/NonD family hydrolase
MTDLKCRSERWVLAESREVGGVMEEIVASKIVRLIALTAAVGVLGWQGAWVRADAPRAELSKPDHEVKVEFDRRIPMRDGVALSADIYRPDATGRFPVILSRTPYLKAPRDKEGLERLRYFATRGYAMVVVDVRGRGDSGGEFVPYRDDGRDGFDTIEWTAAQPWSTGKVGTLGGSYTGKNQWLAALEQPPHLAAMVAMVTPSDPFVEWPTGVPIPMDISWHHFTSGHALQSLDAVAWDKIHRHLPLRTMDEAMGRPLHYWREMFDHAGLDAWWEPQRYQNKFDRVRVPVLHISGWYDDEQIGTPLNYAGMVAHGATEEIRRSQKLLMGPWPHNVVAQPTKLGDVDFGTSAKIDLPAILLRWFDHWLKGIDTGVMREPPVRIFVMGANRWRDEHEWPLARAKRVKYFLHGQGRANSLFGDGALSTLDPATEPHDRYASDPERPVPFITEPTFAQIGGPDDYRPVERRDDVLVYTTLPVAEDTEVTGPIRVRLYAASSAPDTDFTAKLLDVWPDGFAQRLCDGMVRARFRAGMERPAPIEPGHVYPYDIDCWNTSQVFKKGHRIRLEIASSAFPKYDRNPNTGAPLGKSSEIKTADQTVYHDQEHPSHLVLPIVPAQP